VEKAKGVEGGEPIILRQRGFNSSSGSGYSSLCDEMLSHPSEGVTRFNGLLIGFVGEAKETKEKIHWVNKKKLFRTKLSGGMRFKSLKRL
jgi:ABC-type histidine transport system ATPase subunit